jgi:hypothetical protein
MDMAGGFVIIGSGVAGRASRPGRPGAGRESRGVHFRTDFPKRDDLHWRVHVSETCATVQPGDPLDQRT